MKKILTPILPTNLKIVIFGLIIGFVWLILLNGYFHNLFFTYAYSPLPLRMYDVFLSGCPNCPKGALCDCIQVIPIYPNIIINLVIYYFIAIILEFPLKKPAGYISETIKKHKRISLEIVSLLIAVLVFIVIYPAIFRQPISSLSGELRCRIQGHEWLYCAKEGDWNRLFCGCVNSFADGGKECISGNQCQAGYCTVKTDLSYDDIRTKVFTSTYNGHCPEYISVNPGYSLFFPCIYAVIEKGKVVSDGRGCGYSENH
ncbi:MAG: hypothetical protein A2857_01595 [Candidatus Levybacteria bacterium RIFCSPHIGHO2_01_FULL_36_15]|nr:MAG: hypothetical protein A2857_01595 [Candidatus Levybacteria bacterium RIFCSPHIGHO2_01_FULL_36_15]OGH37563.1 MAG: hypothetical protein A2905_01335 [Candidatus Levybacteria bacterium RIFCSPLOWO2_01_FULL_36_10]